MTAAIVPFVTAASLPVRSREREWSPGENPDLWLYRDRTVALLRRYSRLSIEAGRLPSLLGREFFRTHVTSYHMSTFEDVAIFVRDMERSLEQLDEFGQELIAKLVFLDHTQDEAAALLGCRVEPWDAATRTRLIN